MLQGEGFVTAGGWLSCFILELGRESLLSMHGEHSSSCYDNASDRGVLGGQQK